MKNKFFAAFIVLILFENLSFAKTGSVSLPKNDEVVLVGRISFDSDIDKEWLMESFEIPEDKRNYKDVFVFPFIPNKGKIKPDSLVAFNKQAWGINRGYFFIKYKLPKNRTLLFSHIQYYIGASYYLMAELPCGFKITVPEGEKFVYIGDLYYHAKGPSFEMSGAVKDNYDAAQEALNQVTEENQPLCRVSLEDITQEDVDAAIKKYVYETTVLIDDIATHYDRWYEDLEKYGVLEEE